ncbi:MAG: hypothetical protein L0221_01025 [Chloroflexi bacterium]|nr:hypothetical protein [Chloroflexota bacterium]
MTEPLERNFERELERELRSLAAALAAPRPSAGFAAAVTARIEREAPRRTRPPLLTFPRVRRGVLLAIAATLILAAVTAAAVGWRLPGLEIIFGPAPSARPSPSASPSAMPGSVMGLGTVVSVEEAQALVDFPLLRPSDPDLGPPDAVYFRLGRVAQLWSPGDGIPATDDPKVGLLLNQFRGDLSESLVQKIAQAGTLVEPIAVGDARGYWIAGTPHFFYYLDEAGREIQDSYRSVSQTLVWTRDGITYRLETSLDRDAAIRLAESLR